MEQYKAKGYIEFCLGTEGIQYRIYDYDYYKKEFEYYSLEEDIVNLMVNNKFNSEFTKTIYDLMSGEEFLESVQNGFFIDYDGHIADVFVDGYLSNLGLATDNLTQGKFLVGPEVWSEICDEFEVEVNWANK